MRTEHPKLRSDLVISQQESPSGPIYVIKDPAAHRFFQFRAPEFFIIQQFNGRTDAPEIRRRSEEKFGATVSENTLTQFTDRLGRLGLLERETSATEERPNHQAVGRVRGNVFYLRLHAFNPDRTLEWLIGRLSFLFTPAFVATSASVILLAAMITVSNWPEIRHDFARLYQPGAIAMAWVTLLCVVVLHEFAHGLTCKRFGGKVYEMGFLLVFLQPAMFCNVSDAWMFPEKSKRLWVTFAGAYFEIFVWGIATLLWRVTDESTLLNFLSLIVMATSGIKTLFNLNPLIKLDGYYLLSDWVEIPNLRRRAFAYIGERTKNILRGHWRHTDDASPRERRIYWIYGLLAAAYSTWLMGWIALALGRMLTTRYQAWGFAVFCAVLWAMFRYPIKRSGRFLASLFAATNGMLAAMKRLGKIALGTAALGAILFFVHLDLKVSGEFNIVPVQKAEVRAEVEGIISEILVDENDRVEKGTPVVRLAERDFAAQVRKVNAEIEEKQAKLRMLKIGSRPEELDLARSTVKKDEEVLQFSRAYLEMEASLYADKLSSKKDFEEAKEKVALREKELEEARGTLKVLLAGSRPEEIEATQAEITKLTAQKSYLEDQSRRLTIQSPIAGIIITHKLRDKIGQSVKPGDLVAEVHELQTVMAEIVVPEKEISDVRPGQRIMLKARAHPGRRFESDVVSITPVATRDTNAFGQRQFIVTARLQNPDLLLRPEMSGNAKISCGERRLGEIVSRRFVRYLRTEFWAWW
ncbi:MAG: HlyD family efflux transporter periplasmic adaptor subunit [Verrucomicrobia bacterium]|nr:MAG: HlyD family efflux transporter periplasmic adaptor subunit [Verrucomicrobiota bacterium]